jgi:cysteinyl-tRNA synthetase
MHNGMIETDREKMSKSEGNIFQLSEALDRFGAETVVSYLVSGHYRQPLAFGEDLLEEAAARNERIRNYFRDRADDGLAESDPASDQAMERFRVALADDFNTPAALAELFDLLRLANQGGAPGASDVLKEMLGLLGLEGLAALDEGPDDEAFALLEEREVARADGDFERADRIREALRERGWEVRDSGQGATLVPASGS